MSKKSQKANVHVIVKDEPAKMVLIGDTTYSSLGKTSWEGIYNLLEAEDPTEIEEEGVIAGSTDKSENTLNDLANSFLHKIVAYVKVLPYNDLVRWVIESINTTNRAFYTTNGGMFGIFRVEDIKKMYHFLDTLKHYNKAFLEAFSKENDIDLDPIRQ